MEPLQAIYFRDWNNAHVPEILEEIYLKQIYLPFFTGKKDLTVIDAGQNIGLFTYFAKDFARRIIGIEPSAMHRETCQKMLDFNKIENVEILPYALSNKKGKKTFHLHVNTTAYSLADFGDGAKTEEIECITIEDLLKMAGIEEKVDIFKCDVEGEEAKVFTSDEFKRNMDKFPAILGEFHAWAGMEQDQFANMFREYEYEFNWDKRTKAAVFTAVRI